MAEYFRDRGQHALAVIDGVSKHAANHREIALLARQPPGREASVGTRSPRPAPAPAGDGKEAARAIGWPKAPDQGQIAKGYPWLDNPRQLRRNDNIVPDCG
jgi:hypothetical protein